MSPIFSSYFYLEHTELHDTDFWVQWLYPDGTGHGDIAAYTAQLYVAQPDGNTLTWWSVETDTAASAFRFHISDSDPFPFGPMNHDAKIEVVNQSSPDAVTKVIARGTFQVMTMEPA